MFDFNNANEDIRNNQSLEDISNQFIWDAMLMSEKLKYLMGINNFAAIMKYGNLLKIDYPTKVTIHIKKHKAIRDKQTNLINIMYYNIYYFGNDVNTLNDEEQFKIVTFKLFDAVTIRYSYSSPYDSNLITTSYEIIETDYEKLKINLLNTQTFLKK